MKELYVVEWDELYEGWHTAFVGTDKEEAERRYLAVVVNYGDARLIQILIAEGHYPQYELGIHSSYAKYPNEEEDE